MNRYLQFGTIASAAMLTACAAVGPDYKPPPPLAEMPSTYSAQAAAAGDAVDTLWWKRFDDPQLDALLQEGITHNRDIKVASARLRQANALLRQVSADRYPSGDVSGSAERTKRSRATIYPNDPRTIDLYAAGAQASWELDLFGGIRRSVEAATAEAQGADASVHDVRIAVVAGISRAYLSLRGSQARLALARQNADAQRDSLKLTQTRLAFGRGNAFDVARAQSQFDSTRATLPDLETLIATSIARIGVLTGRTPESVVQSLSVDKPPPSTPLLGDVGRPEELLRRRPDLRRAERELASATAQIGVDTADLYPHIGFTGSIGYVSSRPGDFGKSATQTYTIVPGIRWAAFDLYRVRAQIEASNAAAEAALAHFEQAVLLALEETENALADYGGQIQRRASLQSNVAAASKAATLARQRYRDGAASFLDVLEAQRGQLNAQDQLAQTEQAASIALVSVYASLGGGWN